jgi:heat-inducible transcriptional repressor
MSLTQAANYINTEFAGLTIHEVRTAVGERLRQERILYDALVNRALQLASASLADFGANDTLHVQGASLLIDQIVGEPGDRDSTLQTVRALFKMIEEKHRLVELLGRYIETDGVTVVIGSENFVIDLHPFSVIACSFTNAQGTGTVGVIGPTRMRYQKAIAVVDAVSQVMTRVLEGQNRERHE